MANFLLRFSIFLISSFLNSQISNHEKIDNILSREIPNLDYQGKFQEAIDLAENTKKHSISINYLKGEAWSNYRLSNSLANIEDFKRSSEYLKKADELNIKLQDEYLEVAISVGLGRIYNEQNLSYSLAKKEITTALKEVSKLQKTKERTLWQFYIYKNLISIYSNMGKSDSSYYFSQKANSIKEDAYVITSLTNYHLENSRSKDSVLFYLNKSKSFFLANPNKIFEKTIAENQWGQYFFERNQFQESLNHFLIASKLAKEVFSTAELLKSYKNIARCYQKLGNTKKEVEYLKKESLLKDSSDKKLINNLDHSVIEIVQKENERETEKSEKLEKARLTIFGILVFVFLLIIFYLFWKRRRLKVKLKLKLQEKNTIILKKEKLIINAQAENYKILIELAKKNSASFYSKFNEVYPYFQINLIKIAPQITQSELVFCAYIYLGFQTKDIAEYTYRSLKTIQNRKNSIRKTLKIDSKQDLYLYFKDKIRAVDSKT